MEDIDNYKRIGLRPYYDNFKSIEDTLQGIQRYFKDKTTFSSL